MEFWYRYVSRPGVLRQLALVRPVDRYGSDAALCRLFVPQANVAGQTVHFERCSLFRLVHLLRFRGVQYLRAARHVPPSLRSLFTACGSHLVATRPTRNHSRREVGQSRRPNQINGARIATNKAHRVQGYSDIERNSLYFFHSTRWHPVVVSQKVIGCVDSREASRGNEKRNEGTGLLSIFINFAHLKRLFMKITKKRYLQFFSIAVVLLGMVRCIFPQIASDASTGRQPLAEIHADAVSPSVDTVYSKFFNRDGTLAKNRIYSVPNYAAAFPDQNDVQLTAANRLGVKPVADREEAERRKAELVYIGANPYFYVDRLRSSIPYLVPQAAVLLQDIGRNFFDSLQMKGIPLHKIIVTSVMRSQADVQRLRGHNGNATENSCHLYGTTFDVCYHRYKTVTDPDGPLRRQVRNDSLKWVLSEVLNDLRKQNRCYVKYEVHQSCFHITTR